MNQLDLTKQCALCGGRLLVRGVCASIDPDLQDTEFEVCGCTGRKDRGKCGKCDACVMEQLGCACDGAYDIGCFICRPGHFERPKCPQPGEAHG